MDAIVLKRSCPNYKFDRRGLKKVKGVPRDQLNALVDKVEISTNFRREIQKIKRIIQFNVCMVLVLVILSIVAASKSDKSEEINVPSREQLERQMGITFMQNSSYEFTHDSLKQKSEEAKRAIEQAISDYNKTSTIEDDEKTAQILLRTLNSINRKNTLPKLLCILISWLLTAPLILLTKIRNDRGVAYKNVCSLLNIENEMYFCKRGYLWSIDHNVSKLKLCKTHDPKSFEYDEPKSVPEESISKTVETATLKKHHASSDPTGCEVNIRNEMTEEKEVEFQQSGYPMMQFGPPYMMNQVYPPMGYLPWGMPPQGGFQPPMPMYPPFGPMMQNVAFYHQMPIAGPESNPDFLDGKRNAGQVATRQPNKNQHMKESSETGDESDDNDEESDSNPSTSKHRSFGKKRKLNPDSGSVAAKFQTARVVK